MLEDSVWGQTQIADWLMRHPRTIRKWDAEGLLPPADFLLPGKRKGWKRSTLEKYFSNHPAED